MKILIILILFLPILTIDYDLVSGEEKTIKSLNSSETYSLYINALQYQSLNISLIMSDMSTLPFTFLYIKEYSNRASSSFLKSISISNNNNELTSYFTYLVNNYYTQFIALQFTPNYNIDYIAVNINVEGGAYDLLNGIAKNITNLKSGIPYYFFISTFQFQTNSINLTMSYMNKEPFTYSYIYEYSSRLSSIYHKSTNESFNHKQLTSTLTYLVNNYDTTYIALKIIPFYNINYIIAKIDIENHKYKLSNNIDNLLISNLKSGNKYYIFIETNKNTNINTTLTIPHCFDYPLSLPYIYIYELNNYYGLDSSSKKEYIVNDNRLVSCIFSFNYITSNPSIDLVLEIKPNMEIEYIISEITYIITPPMYGLIVTIAIICIFLLIIIIIIICVIKKLKHSKNPKSLENSIYHSLLPTNGNFNNQKQNNFSFQLQKINLSNKEVYYQPQQ